VRANLFAALIGMSCVAGCGGGSIADGGGGGGNTPTGGNVQAITVDSGPPIIANSNSPAVNTAYTTVTICSPGSTTNCQTIDHIQVDTGSSGLRILAQGVLTISLPAQTDANNTPIAECTQFVDGSSWGPIRQADVKIGGETALNQEVQIIGDSAYPTAPTSCSGAGNTIENTVTAFGANGILGVGPFIQDCGSGCAVQGNGVYFTCPTPATCADSAMPALQVANPVASFTADNNGVIIQLPSVGAAGSAAVSGSLIFGIGTQSNNGLGKATVIMLGGSGELTTSYKLGTLQQSFIDSGSNAYYFPDTSITKCTVNMGFYCPASTQALSANMASPVNGTSLSVSFSVTSADGLFKSGSVIAAASNLAGDSTSVSGTNDGNSTFDGTDSFDWGLPFYFGRSVFTAIEGKNTSGGAGPYFAF
jgi:hypothetical protein